MFKKILKICFVILLSAFCFLHSVSAVSPDAIGLRILPNTNHWSAQRWYKEQKFTGSPQSLIVDGYEAVRDGRTVYVNVANIDDKSTATTTDDDLWTNINIISYNQSAESATLDILGQILAHWKFNTNITDEKVKLEIIKDTARLAYLADIKTALENYKNKNGFYPKLSAGSYLSNKTISTWPSWQGTLGKELGITLPIDPVNKLGLCEHYNETTCWNEQNKKFATALPILPENSHAFVYSTSADGSIKNLCAVMSSGYTISPAYDGSCVNSLLSPSDSASANNRSPVVNCDNLIGANGKEFIGYINGYDPDGDYLSWGLVPISIPWTNWASSTVPLSLGPAPVRNYQRIYSAKAGDKGIYSFKAIVSDTKGNTASTTCKIIIGGYCGDGVWDRVSVSAEECDTNDNVATTSAESLEIKQYGCTDECKATGGWCGDAILQSFTGEKCDGTANIAVTTTESSINKQYSCTSAPGCQWAGGYCGDGQIQANYGEQCDTTNGLIAWRCVGSGELKCQDRSCQRFCADINGVASDGTLAQCGIGTSTLSGTINENLFNNKIEGALIEVKDSKDKLIASTTTDNNGRYNFSNLLKSFGEAVCGYKMIVSKDGYQNKEEAKFAFEGNTVKDFVLIPNPLTAGTKIKLTWGTSSPSLDLDAHVKFEADNETIDICYGDEGPYWGAKLETDSKGDSVATSTEIITFVENTFVGGATYRYYIHNYRGTIYNYNRTERIAYSRQSPHCDCDTTDTSIDCPSHWESDNDQGSVCWDKYGNWISPDYLEFKKDNPENLLPVVQIISADNNILYTFSPISSFAEYWYLFDIDGSTGNLTLKNGNKGIIQNEEPE